MPTEARGGWTLHGSTVAVPYKTELAMVSLCITQAFPLTDDQARQKRDKVTVPGGLCLSQYGCPFRITQEDVKQSIAFGRLWMGSFKACKDWKKSTGPRCKRIKRRSVIASPTSAHRKEDFTTDKTLLPRLNQKHHITLIIVNTTHI
ncbi:hypothetical protein POX_g09076 [Penicillium oxalicum]|uniref:Uncharacterized protein n=1 Tax=Penicillium oxalicum (strain 114-2 / CGMCC 5302) TaxID=933388 RepID=S7Z7Q7_PENO1|nr:hypothetical protein POX_g09076 [Penicillium oxalicum]EPS26620.1 hypothetical protein PDE_01558 [Penicillium oxalicum 114-2]KAI2786688.1 hypothetical protein POX_g09076 [Penicillium oxalicum]